MTVSEKLRSIANPVGRIIYFETSKEIGLLYQWDNGETQAALYSDWDVKRTMAEFENARKNDARRYNQHLRHCFEMTVMRTKTDSLQTHHGLLLFTRCRSLQASPRCQ